MKSLQRNEKSFLQRVTLLAVVMLAAGALTACSQVINRINLTGAKRPAASEFGLGPRTSANRLYVVTLESSRALKPRQMQAVRVKIADANGRAVEGATIAIGGGMPQHSHGLPTRPRVARVVSAGMYEIEGVRFNMGGWWEFKVTITSELGADTVTFNLSL